MLLPSHQRSCPTSLPAPDAATARTHLSVFQETAMKTAFVCGPAILAASMTLLTPAPAAADGCAPHSTQNETRFPLSSQMRGQAGTVHLNVVIGATGRPLSADLERSSGYRLLDRAATDSVVRDWAFDVSSCERKDLPVNHHIAIEYRNDPY
jgi:protein TonB